MKQLAPVTSRLILIPAMLCLLAGTGCQDLFLERATPKPRTNRLNATNFEHEVDPIMRGTVSSEGILTGYQPTIVHGYGLVVGLKGTGSRLVPAEVRAMMLAEMARHGIGDPRSGWEHLTPEKMLDSEDTAIVVVEGVIPPAAPKGTTFDVRVFSLPGSTTTSLEGGRLYTTDLRPGALTVGSRQAFALARASGPIFINPFVEPGSTQSANINSLSGRILDGGQTVSNMPVKLRLSTTSHARANTVQQAINSNFPREPGQEDDTARGESGDSIMVTVPPSYSDRTTEFMELLRHTSLQVGNIEMTSQQVRRALLANPSNAQDAKWRWCALGPKAVPMIQDLYDHAEESPRFAALSAGAHLDDALVVPHLLDIAQRSSMKNRRLAAIKHLGEMGPNPRIDMGLRELLEDKDVDIRLATFESMLERRDTLISQQWIDRKFILNRVPCSYPMIYIAQTGEPRIVLFGSGLGFEKPMTLTTWSGRLLMKADSAEDDIQVFYRPREGQRAEIMLAPSELAEFVRFLGHDTTVDDPAPGLNLSYGEVIGAVHELWRKGYLPTDFKAEQDRVLAAILANETEEDYVSRPEFTGDPANPDATFPARPGDDARDQVAIPARGGLDEDAPAGNTVPR